MAKKKLAIVHPTMGRTELYVELCEKLQLMLTKEDIETSVTNGAGNYFSDYDAVLFPSNQMADDAKNAKKIFPDKVIILWGVNIQEEDADKSIVVVKMDEGIEKLIAVIKSKLRAKIIGYKGYCGHWLQVDTSFEACQAFGPRFFHGRIIVLPSKTEAMIVGVAEKCPTCTTDEVNEKAIYYRRINTIGIGFLTPEELKLVA